MNNQEIQKKNIRKKFKSGQSSIGGWMQISNISIAEIFSDSLFDWVAVDLEHGLFNITDLIGIFSAFNAHNKLPIVRIEHYSSNNVLHYLEAGAQGLIVPDVKKIDDLKNLFEQIKLKPKGSKGIGFSRSNAYGKHFKEYLKRTQPLIIPMIESSEGVNNCEEILKHPNIDGVFIGPYDLTTSLGCTGNFDNTNYKKAIKRVLKTSIKLKKGCGIHIIEPSEKILSLRIKEGYNFIAYSLDSVILRSAIDLNFKMK